MPDTLPTFDAEREQRIRLTHMFFVVGRPTPKTFDVEELTLLLDDITAMLGEITRLRVREAEAAAILTAALAEETV